MMRQVILVLVVCLASAASAQQVCPSPCTCQTSGSITLSLDVYCENIAIGDVLPLVPQQVNKLVITDSKLGTLYRNQFLNLGFDSLRELQLSANEITEIELGAFTGLPVLQRLDLSSNRLTQITSPSLINLGNLQVLNLNNNLLQGIPDIQELTNLQILLLSVNDIELVECGQLATLSKLTGLYLDDNKLSALPDCALQGLLNLQELGLTKNYIDEIHPDAFLSTPQLTHLGMSGNLLTVEALNSSVFLPLSSSLVMLTLSGNAFINIPNLADLPVLEHLDVSRNAFKTIPANAFQGLTGLQDLYIEDMVTLESVEPSAFTGLTKLRTLDLEGNKKLVNIPGNAFNTDDTTHLEDVFINNNGIRTFSSELINILTDVSSLRIVTINDNPIQCDCSAQLLQDVMNSKIAWTETWSTTNIPKCGSPPNLKGQTILEIRPRDLTCDPPQVQVQGSQEVQVTEHGRLELKVTTWGGVPNTRWMLPLGMAVQPGETKLGYMVTEQVQQDNTVTSVLIAEDVTSEMNGPYAIISTNANSGTSVTFNVNVLISEEERTLEAAAKDGIMTGREMDTINANEDIMNQDPLIKNAAPKLARLGVQDEVALNAEPGMFTTTASEEPDLKFTKTESKEIVISCIAIALVAFTMLGIGIVLRRRGRDIHYYQPVRVTEDDQLLASSGRTYGTKQQI